jgi:hypothetical protein
VLVLGIQIAQGQSVFTQQSAGKLRVSVGLLIYDIKFFAEVLLAPTRPATLSFCTDTGLSSDVLVASQLEKAQKYGYVPRSKASHGKISGTQAQLEHDLEP